jgi:hypothetical protein
MEEEPITEEYEVDPLEAEIEPGEETPSEPTDEFDLEADAALNTALPMSERRVALKNAIMACMGTDYGAPKEKKGGDDMLSTLLGGG